MSINVNHTKFEKTLNGGGQQKASQMRWWVDEIVKNGQKCLFFPKLGGSRMYVMAAICIENWHR